MSRPEANSCCASGRFGIAAPSGEPSIASCRGDVVDDNLSISLVYGGGGGGRHLGIKVRRPRLWAATLQQSVKPVQLFFSFCLNLESVPLFSKSVVCAAAFCILIATVPVSAAVMAANTATVIARVVWFISCVLLHSVPLLYLY